MSARDSQRSKVYAAEQFVRTLFDRAAEHNSRIVDFFGGSITLPPEARFASVASVQSYVDEVLALPAVAGIRPSAGPIVVRPRRSMTAAHYQRADPVGVIAVPDRVGGDWALRELVVLHEVAHHLCGPEGPAHGRRFVAVMCEMTSAVMGPEVGHVLRIVYAKEGAR